jgi:hypothetical protein
MLPLPAPKPGGSLDDFRSYLNCGAGDDVDDDLFRLLVGFTVGACRPTGPYLVLVLGGEQGSAKSTTARAIRRLIDPNKAGDRSAPRDERDLAIAIRNGRIVSLDNLSRLSDWQSDALARVATGAGFATRQLYTDSDEFMVYAARPIIINGIGDLATRSDLLDRSVLVDLPRIDPAHRRSETELWAAFDRDHPRLLGALLDAVSAAWSGEDYVRLDRPPRMVDATRWVTAAEPVLGWPANSFVAAYARNRSSAHELALDASPIALPLRVLAARGRWLGTASELLAVLAKMVSEDVARARDWPASSGSLGNQLRRLAPNLRAVGIGVAFDREAGTGRRLVTISTDPNSVATAVTPVTSNVPIEPACDDCDICDGVLPSRTTVPSVLSAREDSLLDGKTLDDFDSILDGRPA